MSYNEVMIEIDGSMGEGGGQILRTACALSAITKKSCHVFNIRNNRSNPGLKPQHLWAIRSLAELSNAGLRGDAIDSKEIWFSPEEIESKDINIKIDTAGSITLILQALIPVCLFAQSPVKISFKGGATDTFFSPTFDYFNHVFLRILKKIGVKVEIKILKRGYYPEGEAHVEVVISPSKIKKIDLTERGDFKRILAISRASEHLKEKKVVEMQLAGVKEILGKLNLPIEEKKEYHQSQSLGSSVCLAAEFENTTIGSDNLGKLGKSAEQTGIEAAFQLLKEQKSNACLDKYLADQILLYMALGFKKSRITIPEITEHLKTNIQVIEKFLKGTFEIKNCLERQNKLLISWVPENN